MIGRSSAWAVLVVGTVWSHCVPNPAVLAPDRPSLRNVSLYDALERRHTTRHFVPDADLNPGVLQDILWAAEGVNRGARDERYRTSPSSFLTRTIRVYVLCSRGVFVHEPVTGTLSKISDRDIRYETSELWRDRQSPYLILLVGNLSTLDESARKAGWGLDRETRLRVLWADAAVIAENVYLACAALGVGTGIIAGLNEAAIRRALDLGEDEVPVLAMTLGKEREGSQR